MVGHWFLRELARRFFNGRAPRSSVTNDACFTQEVNQDLVVPPFVLKRRWQEMIMPVIEAWTNTTLEPTDIYGIRTYYDG